METIAEKAVLAEPLPSSPDDCKICSARTAPVFKAPVLGKYETIYSRCTSCGFMQTETPHWLAESYNSAINETDLGPINRAIVGASQIEGLILSCFDKTAKFIDYGAGYGVLVRLMRDRGFDFYWQDLHCQNLFAKHFIASPGTTYELLTAFEVFEHLVDPLADIEAMLGYSNNILFSTYLVPSGVHKAEDWWYFSTHHGQHIAFYTIPALEIIAKRFNLHLSTNGRDMHLLSSRPISPRLFRFFVDGSRPSAVARRVLRRRMAKGSLLTEDFEAVTRQATQMA